MTARFSKTIRLESLGDAPARANFAPDKAERAIIAEGLDIPAVRALTGHVEAIRQGMLIRITGRLDAELERICGVTLEPMTETIGEDFEVLYSTEILPVAEDEISLEDEAPDYLEGNEIDLAGELIQQLSLAMAAWPRKDDAALVEGYEEKKLASPFAALADLDKE